MLNWFCLLQLWNPGTERRRKILKPTLANFVLLSSSGGRLVAQLNFDLLHVKFDKMYDFELNEMQWRQLILSAAAVSYFYIQVKMLTPQSNILHRSVQEIVCNFAICLCLPLCSFV